MMRPPVSCIIPNYNGGTLLPVFFDCLIRAINPERDEVIVVDDCSTDESVEFLKNVPFVKVIRLEKNSGFGAAVNRGMAVAANRFACVLNTDVEVEKDFLAPLCEHFQRQDVFAVSGIERGGTHWALPAAEFKLGIFYYSYYPQPGPLRAAAPVLFAPGTCTLYDREKFLSLGGYDALFRPFYWEDMDICVRAWMRGWSSFYEPLSRYYHRRQVTIAGAYRRRYIAEIHWKNRFLFTWKNIKDVRFLLQHAVFLPAWLICSPFIGKREITAGFFRALAQGGEALRRRRCADTAAIFTERQVISRFKNGAWDSAPKDIRI
jgi:GT2 family glycosyltransferase